MNQSNFGFSKVLSGAYKTLNLANQIIPLYQQISPMVKNARNAFSIIKDFNKGIKVTNRKNKQIQVDNNTPKIKKELSLNNPVFFH